MSQEQHYMSRDTEDVGTWNYWCVESKTDDPYEEFSLIEVRRPLYVEDPDGKYEWVPVDVEVL